MQVQNENVDNINVRHQHLPNLTASQSEITNSMSQNHHGAINNDPDCLNSTSTMNQTSQPSPSKSNDCNLKSHTSLEQNDCSKLRGHVMVVVCNELCNSSLVYSTALENFIPKHSKNTKKTFGNNEIIIHQKDAGHVPA